MARPPRAGVARRDPAPALDEAGDAARRAAVARGLMLGCLGIGSLVVLLGLGAALVASGRGTQAESIATGPASPLATVSPTPACGFQLGFAEFRDLAPAVVGDCLGNEAPDPATGNTSQRTTNGLLVWRSADGLVAFTDGHRSWVRGPDGAIRVRQNDERFPFEAAPPGTDLRVVEPGSPVAPTTATAATPSVTDQELRAYAEYMMPRFEALTAATASMAALMEEAGRRPDAISEEEWRARMSITLGVLRAAGNEIQRYGPAPERVGVLDALVVEIGRDLLLIVDEFATGLDGRDADKIANAGRQMGAAAAKMVAANREMAALASG